MVVGFILEFVVLQICFMLANFAYFAIKYDVKVDNLLTILFLPQIYFMPILYIFFYAKSNIVFVTIKL